MKTKVVKDFYYKISNKKSIVSIGSRYQQKPNPLKAQETMTGGLVTVVLLTSNKNNIDIKLRLTPFSHHSDPFVTCLY